ncbi:MAG: oligosaccharide flippase family protein [bacterium]
MNSENKSFKAFLLVFLSAFGFLVSFIAAPFLARALTLEDNGIYNQAILVIDIAFMLFAVGIGNVTYLYLKRKSFDPYQVFGTNLLLASILGFTASIVIFILSGFFATHFNAPELAFYLKVYCFVIPFKFMLGVSEAVVLLFGRMKAYTYRGIIMTVLNTTSLILIIQVYNSLKLVFIAFLVLSIVQLAYSIVLVPKVFFKNISFEKTLGLRMLKEGSLLAVNGIFGRATLLMDKTVVSSMLNPAQYALYKNGAIEIPFFSGIYRTVSTLVLPEVASYFSEGKFTEIVRLKRKVITNTAFLVYPVMIFLLFFNDRFIFIYLSERYIETVPVFTIFNLTLLIRINNYGEVLLAAGKYKLNLKVSVLGFVFGVLGNIIFIYFFGFIGAAVSTLLTIFFVALVNLYYSSKLIHCSLFDFFDLIFLFKLLAIAVSTALLLRILPVDTFKLINFVAVGVIYSIIVYFIALRYLMKDKSVIIGILTRFPLVGIQMKRLVEKW